MQWRVATVEDDAAIEAFCLQLYAEDPCSLTIGPERIQRTLATFRDNPYRGAALVAVMDSAAVGYALLASFWSNEYGGEMLCLDELYIAPPYRSQGLASALVASLANDQTLWPNAVVALELEVTPRNSRARALYERLGFRPLTNTRMRRPL